MIEFWLLATVMLAVALFFIVRPLLRKDHRVVEGRDQLNIDIARERMKELQADLDNGIVSTQQFEQTRREIEQALANDLEECVNTDSHSKENIAEGRGAAIVVGLAVPVVTVLVYLNLGNLEGLDVAKRSVATNPSSQPGGPVTASVEEMVTRLAERLEREPDNAQGWRLLARSYISMQRYPDAVQALRKARGLIGDDPDILLEMADAIARNQDGEFGGQPTELLKAAMAKAPDNPRVLWMAGQLAAAQGDFKTALTQWHRLEAQLPTDSEVRPVIQKAIAAAQNAINGTTPQVTQPEIAKPTVEKKSAIALSVHVALDPSLANQVDKTDAVFVYAQAMSGPPLPLAVARKQVSDLPLQITLDDTMAMMPAMKLSKFKQVRVAARISKSGNAMPQSGDYQVKIAPIAVTSRDTVSLVIRDKIP